MRTSWGLVLLLVMGTVALPNVAVADQCRDPLTIVIKKDGTTVEGRLVKDFEKGVVLDVNGKSQFVAEESIEEVIEDCTRHPGKVGGAPTRSTPSRLSGGEARFRNAMIDMTQRGLRWFGGGCVGLGCSVCSSGLIVSVLTMLGIIQQGQDLVVAITTGGLLVFIFGVVAGVLVGGGAGMFLGAQLADFLRPSAADMTDAPPAAAATQPGEDMMDMMSARPEQPPAPVNTAASAY